MSTTTIGLVCFFVGYGLGVFSMWHRSRSTRMRAHNLRVIRIDRVDRGDVIITLGNGTRYRGNGTVWHKYPDGKRASLEMETYLSDIETRESWKR